MAILNETKKSTKFKQTLFGGRKNIFTLCIASAENPRNKTLSAEENKQRTEELKKDLNRFRLGYFPVTGKYGGPDEHSFLIANINLKLCKHLFGREKYDQETFIFGVVDDKPEANAELQKSREEQNTKITFYVYTQNKNGEFVITDKETKVINDDDAEYFSIFKKFKFSIPFKTFLEGVEEISSVLEERYGWKPNYKELLFESANTGSSIPNIWRFNCSRFLTEEQELERLKRIGLVEQNVENLSDAKKTLREEIVSLSKN